MFSFLPKKKQKPIQEPAMDVDVVVMKNSGTLGGTETKLTAAIKLGLEIVIIDRPRIDYKNLTHDYDCVGTFVAKYEK